MRQIAQNDPGFQAGRLNAAHERFGLVEQNLRALQEAPGDLQTLKAIFMDLRAIGEVHRFQGLDRAQALANVGEQVLDGLRQDRLRVTAQVIELLFQTADLLRVLVEHVGLRRRGQETPVDPDTRRLITCLESLLASG